MSVRSIYQRILIGYWICAPMRKHIDKISVLKQILWEGVESYLVNQYSSGKISKDKLAELLGLDIYDVNSVLEKYNVKSSISYERFKRGIGTADEAAKY